MKKSSERRWVLDPRDPSCRHLSSRSSFSILFSSLFRKWVPMVRAHFLLLSLLSGLLVSCGEKPVKSAAAASVSRPVTEAQFLKALVAASHSGNPDAVKALVHPATLQRIDDDNRFVFLELFSRDAKRAIPEKRRVTTTAIARDASLPFEGPMVYPVRPTLSLQIEFDESPLRSVTILREVLVDDDGVWWIVFPIPNEEMLARMRKLKAEADQIERLAPDLARKIEAPLLGELKALLRDGRKIFAIKRYREVSREGLKVAKSVIEVLEAEARADSSE